MMDVLFINLIEDPSGDFEIWSDITVSKAMVTIKKNFFGKAILTDITLDNFQQIFIPSGKTGTSKTDSDFTAVDHCKQ